MTNSRLLSLLCAMLIPVASYAGRPLTIDDAGVVEKGLFQVEVGAAGEGDSEVTHWDFPAELAYGIAPSAQVNLGFGGQLEERTEILSHDDHRTDHVGGIGDLTLGGKWLLIPECPLGASHAIAASIKFPTADESRQLGSGHTDYDATWIVSRSIGDNVAIHLNLGYSWIGGADCNVLHYGAALDVMLTDSLQWVGEVFSDREHHSDTPDLVMGNTGLRWTASDTLTWDIAGGARIHGESPDWQFTVGLTWQFGSLRAN
ncbi:MAG: transporter [Kiritimatiellae bacterium]|nr:transporter [Kiritimatiellia bacterium]MCO5067189.1 transporter [Kiritimatiellia bacterium]